MDELLTYIFGFSIIAFILLLTLLSRLQKIEAKITAVMKQLDVIFPPIPSSAVKEIALDPKRKTEAIRVYRKETGVDLRHARQVVDSLIYKPTDKGS